MEYLRRGAGEGVRLLGGEGRDGGDDQREVGRRGRRRNEDLDSSLDLHSLLP